MQVLKHQHHRLSLGRILEEGGKGVKEPEPCLVRVQGSGHLQVRQLGQDFGYDVRDIGGAGAHLGAQLFSGNFLDVGPDGLDKWPIRRSASVFVAPAPHHLSAQ